MLQEWSPVFPKCLALVFQLLDLQALAGLGWRITARAVSSNVAHNWASSLASGGWRDQSRVIKWDLFWGDQTIQVQGNLKGIPLWKCIVWVGNLMTPASLLGSELPERWNRKIIHHWKIHGNFFLKSSLFPSDLLKTYVCQEQLVGFLGGGFGHLKL